VVLVVQANSTPQQAVLEAADLFEESQFVGVVLNQSDEAVGGGHYYGSYGYGGRYGYGKKNAEGKAG
jgi:Mrp family chromosome partitioning ATPase